MERLLSDGIVNSQEYVNKDPRLVIPSESGYAENETIVIKYAILISETELFNIESSENKSGL